MARQLHCIVKGFVQGVFFRSSTQREAKRMGVTGWVRNLPNGTVEIVAEGDDETLKDFLLWVQKGPGSARVDRVDTRWRSFTGEFSDFRIQD